MNDELLKVLDIAYLAMCDAEDVMIENDRPATWQQMASSITDEIIALQLKVARHKDNTAAPPEAQ